MSRIRSADTRPEVAVRSLIHSLGFRFRKNVKLLPGKPDVVLPKYRSIIFVHGCFWHQHKGCNRSSIPRSNQHYWVPKLTGNVKRDEKHLRELKKLGWTTLVIWECETKDALELEKRLLSFLK